MSEDVLIQNSSPTLAGLKTGSLFNLTFDSAHEMELCLQGWNQTLLGKGLRARPLRLRGLRALIYVYRPERLRRDLLHPDAARLLQSLGYCPAMTEQCVQRLTERLCTQKDFPHEIGLFLGYPPEDVLGFIRDAHGQKYTGMWKVYGNVQYAKRCFDMYRKCTSIYCQLFLNGVSLERLVVAQ